jgi:hypothetical protein
MPLGFDHHVHPGQRLGPVSRVFSEIKSWWHGTGLESLVTRQHINGWHNLPKQTSAIVPAPQVKSPAWPLSSTNERNPALKRLAIIGCSYGKKAWTGFSGILGNEILVALDRMSVPHLNSYRGL